MFWFGSSVGTIVGGADGALVTVGTTVGSSLRSANGTDVAAFVGESTGIYVRFNGVTVGVALGTCVGVEDGGAAEGV